MKSDPPGTFVTRLHCPFCGYQMDRSTSLLRNEGPPRAGDVSLCINYLTVCIFDSPDSIHMAGLNEMMKWPPDIHRLVDRALDAARAAKAQHPLP